MITIENAKKIVEVIDCGLVSGVGEPVPGQMCVEAAVCYALGLPHGDNPQCVGSAVRGFEIRLNDSRWSSNSARAEGLRTLAVYQLGSNTIDQSEFSRRVVLRVIKEIVPIALRAAGLEANAKECEGVTTIVEVQAACKKARAAADAAAADAAAVYTAAVYTAYAAAYAAAAYAAAAAAAAAADAANGDEILTKAAVIAEEVLRELNCPGVALWDQLQECEA